MSLFVTNRTLIHVYIFSYHQVCIPETLALVALSQEGGQSYRPVSPLPARDPWECRPHSQRNTQECPDTHQILLGDNNPVEQIFLF